MNDEKLKVVLALLSGIIFSLVFILLAFILPISSPKLLQKLWIPSFKNFPKRIKRVKRNFRPNSKRF